jgi:hypothetical protein
VGEEVGMPDGSSDGLEVGVTVGAAVVGASVGAHVAPGCVGVGVGSVVGATVGFAEGFSVGASEGVSVGWLLGDGIKVGVAVDGMSDGASDGMMVVGDEVDGVAVASSSSPSGWRRSSSSVSSSSVRFETLAADGDSAVVSSKFEIPSSSSSCGIIVAPDSNSDGLSIVPGRNSDRLSVWEPPARKATYVLQQGTFKLEALEDDIPRHEGWSDEGSMNAERGSRGVPLGVGVALGDSPPLHTIRQSAAVVVGASTIQSDALP